MNEYQDIPLENIAVSDRLRVVNDVKASEIAASIAAQGLLYPVVVRRVGKDQYELVDGAYRLRAHELLGLEAIRCRTKKISLSDAQTLEVESNLQRADLTKAERIKFVGRYFDLYERSNPDHGHGGDRRSDNFKMQSLPLENPSEALSAQMEISQRTIRNARKLYKELHPEALDFLAQGPLADNEVQIRAVSELDPKLQISCAMRIMTGEFNSVRDWRVAVGDLRVASAPASPVEGWMAKSATHWGTGKAQWKRRFVREFEDELRGLLAEIDAGEVS